MLNRKIRLFKLQTLLDQRYGREVWPEFETETLVEDLNIDDYLLVEKLYVLKALNHDLNGFLALPEFLIWTTEICNNEVAEFEILEIPTSLELAWMIAEIKKLASIMEVAFEPKEETKLVLGYLLREDGFSEPVDPFDFIPENFLVKGQEESDTSMKKIGIKSYIQHMEQTAITEDDPEPQEF